MAKFILVIDDDPNVIELVTKSLTPSGYRVESAINGHAALQSASRQAPDLILLDVLMPEMDGFTFYKQLKQHPRINSVPVIVSTGRRNMEDTFRALGAADFILKPFDPEYLVIQVDRILNSTPAAKISKKKVLLITQEQRLAQQIEKQLESVGCSVHSCDKSLQSVTKAIEFEPDLFLIDMYFDHNRAEALIERLRLEDEFERKPILIFNFNSHSPSTGGTNFQNALSLDATKLICMKAGATAYLGEVDPTTVLGNLQKYL